MSVRRKMALMLWLMLPFYSMLPVGHAGEVLLTGDGEYPDLDINAGTIHIVCLGNHGGVLYMRSTDSGLSWLGPMSVPSSGDVSTWNGRPAVAGDSLGNAHITWSSGRGSAFYMKFDGTNFSGKETAISSKIVVEPDIAVDSNNVAHVLAYVSDGQWFIGHSKNPGGVWEGVIPVTGKLKDALYGAPTVIGDSVGSIHGAWFQVGGGTIPHYSRFDTTTNSWTDHVTLGPALHAGDILLAADKDGYPRASWLEYRNVGGWYVYGVMYSWKDANGWHQEGKASPGDSIIEGQIYSTAGMGTDELGRSYISWQSQDRLRYAVHDPETATWLIPYSDVSPTSRQYWYSSAAMDDKGYWVFDDDRGLMLAWGSPDDPPGPVQGDINGDGTCNGADLIELALAFGTSAGQPGFNASADLDGNGVIDGNDLSILGGNFGRG